MATPAAFVAPSGKTVYLLCDSLVTGLANNNGVQSIAVLGKPPGGTFTLTYDGATTAPIPVSPIAPAAYFRWDLTVPPGTYDLAIDAYYGASYSPRMTYEVFDGTPGEFPLAVFVVNCSGNNSQPGDPARPATFADGTLAADGSVIAWAPAGRVTLPTGALHVRVSCPYPGDGRNYLEADNLRVATTDGLTVVRVGPATPPGTFAAGPNFQQSPQPWQVAGAGAVGPVQMTGQGVGARYVADPAVVQSALQALSTIGPGNVTVTGDGTAGDLLIVTFVGSLAGVAVARISTSDPTINDDLVTAGGILPIFAVNGTALDLPLARFYWHDTGPVMPTVEVFLPQSPPDVTDLVGNTGLGSYANGPGGYWDYAYAPGFGPYGPLATYGDGSACTMTWRLAPLGPCTMRVSAIWTPDPGLSTAVHYTVSTYPGKTVLGSATVDQTLAPSGTPDGSGHTFQSLGEFTVGPGDGLIVVQSDGTATRMIGDTLRFERAGPDTSVVIGADDVVTASWGDGFATTQAGPVAGSAGPVAVTNQVGGAISPPSSAPTTMPIGWNMGVMDGSMSYLFYQDLAQHGYYYGGPFTESPDPYAVIQFTFMPTAYDANNLSWPNLPNGPWTLTWDGASVLTPGTPGNGTVTVDATSPGRVDFTTSGNWAAYGAALTVRVESTGGTAGAYTYDFTNLRILPGGSDLIDPPTFRADFLDVIRHGASVRHLDTLRAMDGNATEFADFNNTNPSKVAIQRTTYAGFQKIEAWAGGDGLYPVSGAGSGAKYCALKVTCTAHRLSSAQLVAIVYGGPDIPLSGPGLPDRTLRMGGYLGTVFVADPDYFILSPAIQIDPGYNMVGVLVDPDPAGYVKMDVAGTMPLAQVCELANLTGTIPVTPIHFAASDDALDGIGAYFAAHLDPALEWWVQVSNEVWNFGPRGPYDVAIAGTSLYYNQNGGVYWVYYVRKAQLMWDRLRAAFVGAGGDPAKFVRVLDGCIGAYTAELFAEMHANGFLCEKFAVAPYFDNCPSIPRGGNNPSYSFGDLVAGLTSDQHKDMLGIHWAHGGYELEYPGHRAQMVGLQPDGVTMAYPEFAGVDLVSYEGGQSDCYVRGGPATDAPGNPTDATYQLNSARHAHAVVRSTAFYGLLMHRFRTYQDTGCTLFNVFQQSAFDSPGGTAWANFQYTGQLPYAPGDPAQDAIQDTRPDEVPLVRSVSGGVVRAWNALAGPAVPDFALAVSGSAALARGGTATRAVTATWSGGYAGTLTLAATGLPAGVSAVGFVPPSLTGGGATASTLTLAASGSAAVGSSTPSVVGTDAANSLAHPAAFALTVVATAPPPSSSAAPRNAPRLLGLRRLRAS